MSSTDVAQRKAEWEEGVKKFLEVATSTDGWTESHEKLGVQVHRKDTDAIAIIKGAGVIKAKPEAVVEICASLEQRPRWDTFFEGGKLLEVLEEPNNLALGHGWTKGGMGVWPRDVALLLGQRPLTAEEGGGYVLYGQSINGVVEEDTSKFVRATVHMSGFIIRPLPDNAEHSSVTYVFQIDGAGWLPSSITNLGYTYQPLGIIGLRKILTGSPQP